MNIFAIQQELVVPKDNRNEFGNFNYRSCEDILKAVKPLLAKHGPAALIETDKIIVREGKLFVKATAKIFGDKYGELGNEFKAVGISRLPDEKPKMGPEQVSGSASSYARKYALNGLLSICDAIDPDALENNDSTEASINRVNKIMEVENLIHAATEHENLQHIYDHQILKSLELSIITDDDKGILISKLTAMKESLIAAGVK